MHFPLPYQTDYSNSIKKSALKPLLGSSGDVVLRQCRPEKLRREVLLDTVQTSCQVESSDTQILADSARKNNSWRLSQKYRLFDRKRSERVSRCASRIYEETCLCCGSERRRMSYLCADKFCSICARKRSRMLVDKYKGIIESDCSSYYGHMLTVTYKNSEVLRKRSQIGKDLRNLLRRSFWKRHGRVIGGLYGVEVTLSKDGKWHPHVHLLIFTRNPIPSYLDGKRQGQWLVELNQEVSDAWNEITGDSFIVLGKVWDGNIEEMLKYITKSAESLPVEKLRELVTWSRGMRAVSSFGCLYGKKVSEEVEQENGECCSGCGCSSFHQVVRKYDFSRMMYVVEKTSLENYQRIVFPQEE